MHGATPIGSWQPASNTLAIGWYPDGESRAATSDVEKFRPKVRQFRDDSDANNARSGNDKWGQSPQWDQTDKGQSAHDQWGQTDSRGWGSTGTSWGEGPAPYGTSWGDWQKPRSPSFRAARAGDYEPGHADDEEDTDKARGNSRVEHYEAEAMKRLKLKKRPAAAGEAVAKAVAKRPAANVEEKLPKVNIREIMTKSVAESCTRDAFMRKGWEIGRRVAVGLGHPSGSDQAKAYQKAGYNNAKAYLASLGM